MATVRPAFCVLLLVVLTLQFAEPRPKTRRAAAKENPPSPWQNFVRRIQKPFRTVDSALLLLGGGRNGKGGSTSRGPPATTERRPPVLTDTEMPEVMGRMVMDPGDIATPKGSGAAKPTAATPSSPLSVDAPTWNLQHLSNHPCGISPANITDEDRVCSLGQFPWLALLRYTAKDKSVNNFCGGSLVNERYVLTAASCLEIPQHKLDFVRLGEFNLDFYDSDCSDVEDGLNDVVSIEACYGEPPVDYGVSSVHAHPEYNPTSGENNAGLVRLAKKVAYTPIIAPVCLPLGDMAINWNGGNVGTELILAGWGDNVVPREALTTRAEAADCEDAIGDTVAEGQICASGQGGRALCHGDVGGALLAFTMTRMTSQGNSGSSTASMRKRYVQLGLLVSKSPYCYEDPPLIFDGVERFMPWILNTMKP